MHYVDLHGLERGVFDDLRKTLQVYDDDGEFVIPQIGLALPSGESAGQPTVGWRACLRLRARTGARARVRPQ